MQKQQQWYNSLSSGVYKEENKRWNVRISWHNCRLSHWPIFKQRNFAFMLTLFNQNGLPIIHETFGLPIIHETIDSLPINGRPTGGIIVEKIYLYYKKMKLILRNVEHRMVQVLRVAIAQELLLGLKNSDHLQNIPMAETISLT